MVSRELVLDFAELNRISIGCPKCEAEILFNLLSAVLPSKCPACTTDVDRELIISLRTLQEAYRGLVQHRVRVRVPGPD
jgi:uncharacterized protein (UPF0212 family)